MPPVTAGAVLYCGMGYDSCFWLTDYLLNARTRTVELEAVVIAQTGSESVLVQQQMEAIILPLLRQHQIRTVQIARATSSLRDGFVVLDDTRSPTICGKTWRKPHDYVDGAIVGIHFKNDKPVAVHLASRLGRTEFCKEFCIFLSDGTILTSERWQ